MHPDSVLIKELGGPTKVAELLSYDKATGGVQRVQNWMRRGIPPAVKLQRPDLFLTTAPAPVQVVDDETPRRAGNLVASTGSAHPVAHHGGTPPLPPDASSPTRLMYGDLRRIDREMRPVGRSTAISDQVRREIETVVYGATARPSPRRDGPSPNNSRCVRKER